MPTANSTYKKPSKHKFGFTLVETLVAMGVFAILMGLVIANYRRGNDDSILSREANLLMARIRLAQEQSAAGAVAGFCTLTNLDTRCTQDSDCSIVDSQSTCTVSTPSGGFGMFFSCETGSAFGNNHWPSRDQYFMFADRVQCLGNCFPFNWNASNWGTTSFVNMDKGMDHLFSSDFDDTLGYYKGDTIAAEFAFDPKVTLQDIQLVENDSSPTPTTCNTKSPWSGENPLPLSPVPTPYPLQATIHFPSPDGRSIVLSDNVSLISPPPITGWHGKSWKEINLMLALTNRKTVDCRVVRITKDGVISQSTDADCQF